MNEEEIEITPVCMYSKYHVLLYEIAIDPGDFSENLTCEWTACYLAFLKVIRFSVRRRYWPRGVFCKWDVRRISVWFGIVKKHTFRCTKVQLTRGKPPVQVKQFPNEIEEGVSENMLWRGDHTVHAYHRARTDTCMRVWGAAFVMYPRKKHTEDINVELLVG